MSDFTEAKKTARALKTITDPYTARARKRHERMRSEISAVHAGGRTPASKKRLIAAIRAKYARYEASAQRNKDRQGLITRALAAYAREDE